MIYKKRRYGKTYTSGLVKVGPILNFSIYLLLIFLLCVVYFAKQGGFQGGKYNIQLEQNLTDEDGFKQSAQYYPNLRFASRNLNYSIINCTNESTENIELALDKFRKNTNLTFTRVENPYASQLRYFCNIKVIDVQDFTILGDGGPGEILIRKTFLEITYSKINIYEEDDCPPLTEFHETLHALGFSHNNNPNSIMFPIKDCTQVYNEYFYNRINDLYSGV